MSHRLGDEVDDYCSRCRMLTNNSVEALVGDDIVKVRCRTCNYSHDYKHGQVPEKSKPRRSSQKAAFDEVLASVVAGKQTGPAEQEAAEAGPPRPRRPRKEPSHHGLFTLSAARRKSNPTKN